MCPAVSAEYLQTTRKRVPKPRQITFPEDRLVQSFFARHPKARVTTTVRVELCVTCSTGALARVCGGRCLVQWGRHTGRQAVLLAILSGN